MDNFFTGSKENIAHLIGKTNFELIRHDVVEKILLEVDQIYHLACPALANPLQVRRRRCFASCSVSAQEALPKAVACCADIILSKPSKPASWAP